LENSKQNEKKYQKKGQQKLTRVFKGYERYTKKEAWRNLPGGLGG